MNPLVRTAGAALAAATALALLTPTDVTAAPAVGDRTSTAQARLVDAVPTPKLDWWNCTPGAQCATAHLPLDYGKPKGPTTAVALVRVKARKPKQRIGSLFINPGGPGGSGIGSALDARDFLSPAVVDRFDIIGVDPRGVNFSEQVRCFASAKEQQRATAAAADIIIPTTAKEEKLYITAAQKLGKACSTTGQPLAAQASTTENARDLDVLRRAVGDKKLNYLGFSYGTALGQYYANMFPDRVRAMVLDGVVDASSWYGNPARPTELDSRLGSGTATYRALQQVMSRCAKNKNCGLLGWGPDPLATWKKVAETVKKKPVTITTGAGPRAITYGDFVGDTLGALFGVTGFETVMNATYAVMNVIKPLPVPPNSPQAAAERAGANWLGRSVARGGDNFPYDNGAELFAAVTCGDGAHPAKAEQWPALMKTAAKKAPYFGPAWGWQNAPCATSTWTKHDQRRFGGPFNHTLGTPVLFVGNYWDPATSYTEAISAAKAMPGSYLITSDSWGHTAYGTSACTTGGVDQYLLTLRKPAKATCVGDIQPTFPDGTETIVGGRTERAGIATTLSPATQPTKLPPVVLPWFLANRH